MAPEKKNIFVAGKMAQWPGQILDYLHR